MSMIAKIICIPIFITLISCGGGGGNDTDELGGDVTDNTMLDADADGIPDSSDNCPESANPSQIDSDGDGTGDTCDPEDDSDSDGDGLRDASDNCPTVSNPDQGDDDNDGIGNSCDAQDDTDTDSDGVRDGADNCPNVPNANQEDGDGDGVGDACDSTDDSPPSVTFDDVNVTTLEGQQVTGQIEATHSQGKTLTYAVTSPPTIGTLTISSNGSYTFASSLGEIGQSTFAFQATDSDGIVFSGSGVATVELDHLPPEISNIPASIDVYEFDAVEFSAVVTDPRGGTISNLQWNQTAGPTVLSPEGFNTLSPSFEIPELPSDDLVQVMLTATNEYDQSSSWLVSVNVKRFERLGGAVLSNRTLPSLDRPYLINSRLTVAENVTLTIQPGVEIRSLPLPTEGSSRYPVEISGSLRAIGTNSSPIIFRRAKRSESWLGIRTNSPGSLDLDRVIIEGAGRGLDIAGSGTIALRHCVLRDNEFGITATHFYKTVEMSNMTFERNYTAIFGIRIGDGGGRIERSEFIDNQFAIDQTYQFADLVITESNFINNPIAIEVISNGSASTIVATNNYFGTNVRGDIEAMIVDRFDDAGLPEVPIDPFASSPFSAGASVQ